MELIDIVFNYLTNWITLHKPQSIGISAILLVVLILINPKAAKAAGRAFSDLLKRIPIFGKPIEDKIEKTGEAFVDGMEEDNKDEIKEKLTKEYPTVLGIEVTKDGKIE